jgi:hypothetical protein
MKHPLGAERRSWGGEVIVVVETLIGIVAIGAMTLVGVPLSHLRRGNGGTRQAAIPVPKITGRE